MSRKMTIGIFLGSLLTVSVGAFYLGEVLTSGTPFLTTTSSTIIDEAKQRVPLLSLPPKPAGHIVMETKIVERSIQVPEIKSGFLPQIIMRTQVIKEQVPAPKLVDASLEETASWESKVKVLQDQYNLALQNEIKKISREKELESMKETATFIKGMVIDGIVPVVLAIAGLVGAIVSLRNAFKAKGDAADNT